MVLRATQEAPTNEEIAQILDLVAEFLEAQDANRFRVAAYRRAGETLRTLESRALDILETSGLAGLASLPGIGESLARAIAEVLETGGLQFLERLRGQATPEVLFATVPGIGPRLAAQIHEELGIETLEELESAAHDGRLARVRGFGPRRLRAIAESLAGRLGRRTWRSTREAKSPPPVAELLEVDRVYRDKASAGTLRRIAPRRFNPERKPWLPILHTAHGDRHYTALFSNTARAHELGKTDDWVVLYLDDGQSERQSTVVTETRGPLAGRRVVRGREEECREYYDAHPTGPGPPPQDS
ncbi:MAG TPA: helix-hairpin-helix domain-containing protein [Vicinamibacteria bacterium]|nr:helix-hairpin-helix domain-containing protein [Vicinamibacteria bacterium]